MKRQVSKQTLRRLNKAKSDEKAAQEELEAVERAEKEEKAAEKRRDEKAALDEKEKAERARVRQLITIGGIVAKAGLTGLPENDLEALLCDARDRHESKERPELALAMLIDRAGLGGESREVIYGILLRGRERLDEPGFRDQFKEKGRRKLEELAAARGRKPRKEPIEVGPINRPPMMVKFKEPPSVELRDELKRLGMKYFSDRQEWRGPNDLATAVRVAVKMWKVTHLVAYPTDWRDD